MGLPVSIRTTLFFLLVAIASVNAQTRSLQAIRNDEEELLRKSRERVRQYLQKTKGRTSLLDSTQSIIIDIAPDGQPVYRTVLNAGAAQTTGAAVLHNPTSTGLRLEGEGMEVAVWDNGKVIEHVEFDQRVISTEGDVPQLHASHVTGTLIAAGVNPLARGMAPKAKARTFYFGNDVPVMAALSTVDNNPILISNHSYGTAVGWFRSGNGWQWVGDLALSNVEDYRFGFYGDKARVLDELAYQAPYYSIFWAAGNDRADTGNGSRPADCNAGTGYDCIIPDAVAKNVFTIGAVKKTPIYTSAASVIMGDYSSWGPTDDGRIKPDLVGAGSDLLSTSSASVNAYSVEGGTSMATPNVAGSLLLVQELFSKLHGGNFMKSATLKALAIHTAKEAGPFNGPDYSYGWGLVDVVAAADFLMKENGNTYQLLETTLQNSQINEIVLHPKANTKITATIAWTDPAGTVLPPSLDPSSPRLVNDLDIRLVDADGVEQSPWILDPNNPSRQAFRGDNFRDNVEKIEFVPPEAKTFRLIVRHKGVLEALQNYSLILSFQATDAPRTLYWIGSSGNWSDASHWSFTSGGPGANTVPTASDRIVVDDNAFDDASVHRITLQQDESIHNVRWVCTKEAMIDLNGRDLKIGGELTVASSFGILQNGTVVLNTDSEGSVQWHVTATQPVVFKIDGGKWTWNGNVSVDELHQTGGEWLLMNSRIAANHFKLTEGSSRKAELNGSDLVVGESISIDGSGLDLQSQDASILLSQANAKLSLGDVIWDGTVSASAGGNVIDGSGGIGSLRIQFNTRLDGELSVDELTMTAGSTLTIGSNRTLRVKDAKLNSSSEQPIELLGETQSSIEFTQHERLCFDFLRIASLPLTGMAVVSVGENSIVENSPRWVKGKCEDALLANFEVKYPCANGLMHLVDASLGAVSVRTWQITARNISATFNTNEVKFALHDGEQVSVQLTVESASNNDQTIKTFLPQSNTLPAVEIGATEESLVSVVSANQYQWYNNGEEIPGAGERTYPYAGAEGSYFVVVYNDDCSRISETHLITGVEKEVAKNQVFAYPNPASEWINISADHLMEVRLTTIEGRSVLQSRESKLNVASLPEGLYLLTIRTSAGTFRTKVAIRH